jgi:hypothetical protein
MASSAHLEGNPATVCPHLHGYFDPWLVCIILQTFKTHMESKCAWEEQISTATVSGMLKTGIRYMFHATTPNARHQFHRELLYGMLYNVISQCDQQIYRHFKCYTNKTSRSYMNLLSPSILRDKKLEYRNPGFDITATGRTKTLPKLGHKKKSQNLNTINSHYKSICNYNTLIMYNQTKYKFVIALTTADRDGLISRQ